MHLVHQSVLCFMITPNTYLVLFTRPPNPITHMLVSSNQLLMAMENRTLLKIDLMDPSKKTGLSPLRCLVDTVVTSCFFLLIFPTPFTARNRPERLPQRQVQAGGHQRHLPRPYRATLHHQPVPEAAAAAKHSKLELTFSSG